MTDPVTLTHIQRLEAESIEVDGHLNEAVWSEAAVLAGVSRYAPVDGEPADHATDVLVWYSPTAIHFGIRAAAPAELSAVITPLLPIALSRVSSMLCARLSVGTAPRPSRCFGSAAPRRRSCR